MSIIQSERIMLLPLTIQQMEWQISNLSMLEQDLNLFPNSIELDESFTQEIAQALSTYSIPNMKEYPDDQEWYASWIIINKQENKYVGSIGTGGKPNEKGEVMIGYYIDRKFNGLGIASEAVKLFIEHLFRKKDVHTVYATIPVGHIASEKVVAKNNFVVAEELEEEGMKIYKWILHRTL